MLKFFSSPETSCPKNVRSTSSLTGKANLKKAKNLDSIPSLFILVSAPLAQNPRCIYNK